MIKPCPFCGTKMKVVFFEYPGGRPAGYQVDPKEEHSIDCYMEAGVHVVYAKKKDCTKHWNMRSDNV